MERLEEQGAEVIVCLSPGGTIPDGTSEDEELARAVEGIDLIVSGHTHTALEEPILAGETYIVSAGEYGKNLGSVTLSWNEAGEKTLTDYRLIPLDGTWESDPEIAALIGTSAALAISDIPWNGPVGALKGPVGQRSGGADGGRLSVGRGASGGRGARDAHCGGDGGRSAPRAAVRRRAYHLHGL